MFRTLRGVALLSLGLGLISTPSRAEPQKTATAPAATAPATKPASPELSATQRQQVEALRDKTERQLAPLREQLTARNKELFALWSAEPPNRAAILKKDSEVTALRQKIRQLLIEQRLAQLALLTPGQRGTWRSQHASGSMEAPGMGCGCMRAGKDMGGMHGDMGGMHGGMGNQHGGMGMGAAGGMPLGMEDCLDCMGCMNCEGTGACAPASPAPPAPAAPAAPRPH
jgi:hypothetical protein